ncbi:MAG TPA: RsmE family RNA methyltransferase [Candidatus Acidoferrum sp.]|nr:RsmE family RNA methyltransferase [Candidatus Acidoferrum sp.]
MRRRFFVEGFQNGRAVMAGEAAHHLGHVLRAHTGQLLELSDGQSVWLAEVEKVARERIEFKLVDRLPAQVSATDIILLLSIVKFDAFEWALEKATELGVGRIMPIAAERSEKALLKAAPKRADRWKKILLGASEQSRRVRAPSLGNLTEPEQAFSSAQAEIKLLLSERQDAPPMKSILEGKFPSSVALAIGPEGGWSDPELSQAERAGFLQASMGSLILRTETAVIAALANLNYSLSRMNVP